MISFPQQKQELRSEIKDRLRSLSAEEKQRQSQSICQRLLAKFFSDWQALHTFAVFAPLPSEPDIWPFIELLWQHQKKVAFPTDQSLAPFFKVIHQRDELVKKDGFWQPSSDSQDVALPTIDMFIVPGTAFTQTGQRLGRGGGRYDRVLLQRSANSAAVGVCFTEQIVEELPMEEFDRQVDEVLFQ